MRFTIVIASYFLAPLLIRWSLARFCLKPFGRDDVSTLLWGSWVWTCFAALFAGLLIMVGRDLTLTAFGASNVYEKTHWFLLPVWLRNLIGILPYWLLCLAFDWWLAFKVLGPRDGSERARIPLWLWPANLLWLGVLMSLVWVLSQGLWT